MKRDKNVYANIGLFIVALIWGSGFVVTKEGLNHIGPHYMLFYRFSISFFIMSVFFFRKFKLLNKDNIKAGMLLGLFMFLGFVTQTVGLEFMEAGKQAFIVASSVVLVPFIYWFLSKVRPDGFDIIGALMSFIGVAIISMSGGVGGSIGKGEFLTFMSAISFAFHTSAIGYFARKHDPVVLTLLQMFTAGVLSLLFAFKFEGNFVLLNANSAPSILYLAVFNTFVAFTLQNISQRYTSSTNAAIILSLESVIGAILAIIILKEKVTARFIIGSSIVFIGVLLAQTKLSFIRNGHKRKKANENE